MNTSVTQNVHQSLPHKTTGDIQGTNFPMDGEGRVFHLALKRENSPIALSLWVIPTARQ